MAKTIHTMIRVLDEARSTDFYGKAFGFTVADRFEFDGFVLVYLRDGEGEHEVELTVNKGRSTPYDLGDGYGHVAISVADLAAARARIAEAGFSPGDIKTLSHASGFSARFFFVADPDGYKIEVLERGGRFL